jgi:muconolactone delta-isomerase
MIRRSLAKILTPPMIALAALIMFLEEWVWDHLAALMAWLARAPVLRWLESRIAALPPYPAIGLFVLPGLLLMPVKIFALWLIAQSHAVAGAGVFVAAKVIGTAIVARLFAICRPTLLTVRWFRAVYEWLVRLKARLYHSMPWQKVVAWKNRIRERWRKFTAPWRGGRLKRRWRAVFYLMRRKLRRPQPEPATAANRSGRTPP